VTIGRFELVELFETEEQAMPTSTADLVAEARSEVEDLTPVDVAGELAGGAAVVVDLREPAELDADGMIEGAIHAPRGMLEFYADPSSPYHRPELDPARRTVLYCASGGRSALAARALVQLGYTDVAHLGVGFKGWLGAGRPVVRPTDD
jgi:rhodanese-related sulfurtransferase